MKAYPDGHSFVEAVFQPDQSDLEEAQVTAAATMDQSKPARLLDLRAPADQPDIAQTGGYHQSAKPCWIAEVRMRQVKASALLVGEEGFDAVALAIIAECLFSQVHI